MKIYDGEHLIQVQPHENGYALSLSSKSGLGDAAFLRTYGREERFREILETEFEAIDSEVVFEVLEEHFEDQEYRIVNLKKSIKTFHGRGADLIVETGEKIPTLTDDEEYRNDKWSEENTYRLRIWPSTDLWIEVYDTDSGECVADYRPNSLLEDIRNEEKDDHDRERGPTCVPGVHAPVASSRLDNAPVVHTRYDCSHLDQLKNTQYNPADEMPPKVPAGAFGELPLRWCSLCQYQEPTPDEIHQQYGP